jgi:hypothetical protein
MIPSFRLQRRILEAERAFALTHAQMLVGLPGNPAGVVVRNLAQGGAALLARRLPVASLNRVLGLNAGDAPEIEPLLAWYGAAGQTAQLETVPGYADQALGHELVRVGCYQSAFQVVLCCPPSWRAAACPGISIDRVASACQWATFAQAYGARYRLAGAQDRLAAALAGELQGPHWSLYLGRRQGGPAAAALFFTSGKVGYCAELGAADPLLEGALIGRCLADARLDVVATAADLLSERHLGLVAIGMQVLFVRALWTPLSRQGQARLEPHPGKA